MKMTTIRKIIMLWMRDEIVSKKYLRRGWVVPEKLTPITVGGGSTMRPPVFVAAVIAIPIAVAVPIALDVGGRKREIR